MEETTILVVDDESRIRKLLKDFLIKESYSILEAADGEEALKGYEEKNEYNNPDKFARFYFEQLYR